MRILMLNNEFPPLGGGTGTVNQALLECFARVPDLNVDLVTSALGSRYERQEFGTRIQILKVPVNNRNIHHSSNRELLTFAARGLALGLKLQRRQAYELCVAWSAVPAGGVALALRRLTGLRYVVRVCGPDIPGFEQRYRRLYRVLTPFIRKVWREAETVVAKCAGEADMIRAMDPDARIALIQNSVDPDLFRPGEPIADEGPLRVLCVGRLIERKGQHHLIRAIRILADQGVPVTLELVGTGDARADDEALATGLGVAELVHFAGYVPREQMPARYAAAHVFVLPSYNEGMSVAMLEALAAGLPIIATRTPGTDLVISDANGSTFDWGDVEALARHLRRLALDRPLARRMGAGSRLHAEGLSWTTVADSYLHLFQRVLARTDGQERHASAAFQA